MSTNSGTDIANSLPLVPVRMVNEWVYCPRLAYLEWVEGEWADTSDTVAGRRTHARVDSGGGRLPQPDAPDDPMAKAHAVTLSSSRLGIIAKMDVVELKDGHVTPIDFKKGKRPHVAAGAYEPERVQVCAQAMILEDNGYTVSRGIIWFAGSRERVFVDFDEQLRATTLEAIAGLRSAAQAHHRPPPLEDSPKCPRCALAGICLPDETNIAAGGKPPRQLNPADDAALPLYVQTPGAKVRKRGERLLVESGDDRVEVAMMDVSQLSLFGPTYITTQALHGLLRAGKPVSWFSTGGWFLGHTMGTGHKNVLIRRAQFKAAFDETACLQIARELVVAKIRNSRTMLRRNWRKEHGMSEKPTVLASLKRSATSALAAGNNSTLLGHEGAAASVYFSFFSKMLAQRTDHHLPTFSFLHRNRRPPKDPVNSMLSLGYAVLAREFTTTISAVGLDPYQGMFHQPRHGRPALALDLMEPFRSIVADSCVISTINNCEIGAEDFVFNGPSCSLTTSGRKAFLSAFERRMARKTTHPVFGYRISMRRLIEVQVRLFSRFLQGEIDQFPHYMPR